MYQTMHNVKNKCKSKRGFTLAELLIVVAIIAILVAIAVPVFSGQLERAREATDAANLRAAYAEVVIKSLENGGVAITGPDCVEVKITQTGSWEYVKDIAGEATTGSGLSTAVDGKIVKVGVDSDGDPVFTVSS